MKNKENTSAYVVWNRLGDRTQDLIQEYVKPSVDTDAPGEQFNRINQVDFIRQGLHRDFREMIDDPGFYDSKSFADLELGEETGELAKQL